MTGEQSSRDEEGLPRDEIIKAVIQEDYWNNGLPCIGHSSR